ncbi:MAG: DeoR family transcriptional regulator [Candidatus Dojkabacteria bacterium]|jgi:Fic family protein
MQKENCNNKSCFPNFFTLLAFILGFVLYIIIKHGKSNEGGILTGEKILMLKGEAPLKKVNKVKVTESKTEGIRLTDRQERIVERLMQKGKMFPSQLQDLLPEVSARTVRRDMTSLEKQGLVKQKGTTKSTYYVYIGS